MYTNSSFPFPGSLGADARPHPTAAHDDAAATLSADVSPPSSADFISLLLDDRHRFPILQHRALCEWLPSVLVACRSWPLDATLVWDDGSASSGPGESSPPWPSSGQAVLRLGLRWTRVSDVLQQQGVASWDDARPETVQRIGAPPPGGGAPPSDDVFDLLAAAVDLRSAALSGSLSVNMPGSCVSRGRVTGMTLRQELADWLQTPAGRQAGQTEVAPWLASAVEPADEGLVEELAAFIQDELSAGNVVVARTVAPVLQPGPADHPLDQAIHTLQSGGWCEQLDHLIPTLLVRLPPNHRCRVAGMRMVHAGESSEYGWPGHSSRRVRLSRQPDGTVIQQGWSKRPSNYRDRPDSFLEAAFRIFQGSLNRRFPNVRQELAAIMAWNRPLMELRLALAERAYPCDQEMLLRMCLVQGQLTLAGEQLLHPERPQRAVTADDMARWFHPAASAHERDPMALVAQGISVVDAYRLASPLRPTLAGTRLMGLSADHFSLWRQHDAQSVLEQRFPELVYACQTSHALAHYLRISKERLRTIVSVELNQHARGFREQAAAAERVELPPNLALAIPRYF